MSGAKAALRRTASEVFNFTGRMDIQPGNILFRACHANGMARCQVTLRNWIQVLARIAPRHLLTLQFERSGEPVLQVDCGSAARHLRAGGVVTADIPGGFDLSALGVRIYISDPDRSYLLVASGWKGRPDVVEELPEAGSEAVPVRPVREAPGKGRTLLYAVEAPTSGGWNIKMRGVEMPHLVIDPAIGRDRFKNDPALRLAIECEAFRRIVTELASRGSEYDAEPWADRWKEFAAHFSGIGDWSYFADEADDVQSLEARVDDAVDAFRKRGNYDQHLAARGGATDERE